MTLLELVVAVLVLSIGTLAAVRGTDQARLEIGTASDRVFAGIIASNRAAELRLYGPNRPLPAQVDMGGRKFAVTQQNQITASGLVQVDILVQSTATGAGASLLSILPPGQGLR